MAQSFSLGTVSRAKFHRRSVRFAESNKNGQNSKNSIDSGSDDDSDLKENSYTEHIRVVDAFDEILNELENVRISTLPKKESGATSGGFSRIRPSSIKGASRDQRPYSTYVPKVSKDLDEDLDDCIYDEDINSDVANKVIEAAGTDRDSGYLSQHNSQSSVASSESAESEQNSSLDNDCDEAFFNNSHNFSTIRRNNRKGSNKEANINVDSNAHININSAVNEIEQKIFEIIDFWSFHFTGDLHFPESLHLVMEILEKLRNKNQVRVIT